MEELTINFHQNVPTLNEAVKIINEAPGVRKKVEAVESEVRSGVLTIKSKSTGAESAVEIVLNSNGEANIGIEKLFGGPPTCYNGAYGSKGVLKADFLRIEAPKAKTSSISIAIFFFQTCNLCVHCALGAQTDSVQDE